MEIDFGSDAVTQGGSQCVATPSDPHRARLIHRILANQSSSPTNVNLPDRTVRSPKASHQHTDDCEWIYASQPVV